MVYGIAREMADRFIEFVLKFFKGESVEVQLTKALRISVMLITLLLFTSFTLLSTILNQRIELEDAEIGLSKINVLFDSASGPGGPISQFVRINDALTRQLDTLKSQYVVVSKQANTYSGENKILRGHLVTVLEENGTLKKNNETLLKMCVPRK